VIVEAFGNKLAFDLEWKPLLSGSHAQATQAAAAIKAKLMWHDSRVRAVTAEDMRAAAQRYFDPSRRVEGIVRGIGRTV